MGASLQAQQNALQIRRWLRAPITLAPPCRYPTPSRRVSWKGSNKKKKKDSKKKGEDYYALLGLKNERWTATPKQLKDGECRGGEGGRVEAQRRGGSARKGAFCKGGGDEKERKGLKNERWA